MKYPVTPSFLSLLSPLRIATAFAASILLCLALLPLLAAPARGAENRIVAVVDTTMISRHDLQARRALIAFATGLPEQSLNDREVLDPLIDEALQRQAAAREKITITDAEVTAHFAAIEKNNNLAPGALLEAMRRSGVDPENLRAQIQARMAWSRLIQRKFAPAIVIRDQDVDSRLEGLRRQSGQPRQRVLEIFIPFDTASQRAEAQRLTETLRRYLERGADFRNIARQFSRSRSAENGGDLGWIGAGDLPPFLENAVKALRPGALSAPIETAAGYYLFQIAARPDATGVVFDLLQTTIPAPPQASAKTVAELRARADDYGQGLRGCDVAAMTPERLFRDATATRTSKIAFDDLAPEIQHRLSQLQQGRTSEPILTSNGLLLLTVCARHERTAATALEPETVALPSKEETQQQLMMEQLEVRARRYLQNLRRDAVIDNRLDATAWPS